MEGMRAWVVVVLLSLVSLTSFSLPAHASLVLALDLPTMVTRADHVAVVDVVSVKSGWDARHEQILSTVDLVVVESWKGGAASGSHLTVVQPGGTVGDLTQVVHGITHFTAGERAVVFLAKRLVRRDAASGRMFVHAPDKAGATFIRSTPASANAPIFQLQARPLDELRADVRTLAVKPGAPSGAKPPTSTGGAR